MREAFLKRRNMLEGRLLTLMQYDLKLHLKDTLENYQLKHIGIFYPINSEIDVRFLEKDYTVYYPKVEQAKIVYYENTNKFYQAPFNTYEPNSNNAVDKNQLDAVIVPGLVFDDALYRIGYGKGYFDAFLSDYKGLKVGVCYDLFKINKIPIEPHDVKMDLLVTNSKVYGG